ncbi:carboxymuconolactone decarboxylase family protein [Oceanicoccus sp. KOV_DT_Chl]|uniref:carboxymuconolactone decarboxylase family protein n=1 Tax=Oceanicoccus sp. KOV_DT_Chl TaxID=1904639 RepID=UPI000C7D1EF0|nr:carboxymuconolactone decarboxylase family protein [Oceanicoccus sp. KOV_DT_Chl]
MSNDERRNTGKEKIMDVYAGDVVVPEQGYAFSDIMLETLFAEIWTRDIISMRDKRILLLGMIAAQGEATTFKIQTKAAIKRGDLNAEEIRELHLFIAQYCGYPKAAAMLFPMEEAIAEATKDLEKAKESGAE